MSETTTDPHLRQLAAVVRQLTGQVEALTQLTTIIVGRVGLRLEVYGNLANGMELKLTDVAEGGFWRPVAQMYVPPMDLSGPTTTGGTSDGQ